MAAPDPAAPGVPPAIVPVLAQIAELLERIAGSLPPLPAEPDWSAPAFYWRRTGGAAHLLAVPRVHQIHLADLLFIEDQKAQLVRNTEQFLGGRPANNALLWGARGTGKSSLIKALFNHFRPQGLRLIQVERADLVDLPLILERLRGREERFLLYCDDLAFEADDLSFKALKSLLEGSIFAPAENLLLYASSNRRHLVPEYPSENQDSRLVEGELHHGESVEEKVSLSDRFGLWLSFHPFSQAQYLETVFHWMRRLGCNPPDRQAAQTAALQWALRRGSRSGRTAWQFARDWAGREFL